MKNKKMSSYKIMTSILNSYNPTLEEKKTINSFFLCRWLSNSPKAIYISNIINRFYKEIPVPIQYDFAKDTLSKDGVKYIKYSKKDKEPEKAILNICKYYNVSIITANSYYELMDKEEKYKFEHMYDGIGE